MGCCERGRCDNAAARHQAARRHGTGGTRGVGGIGGGRRRDAERGELRACGGGHRLELRSEGKRALSLGEGDEDERAVQRRLAEQEEAKAAAARPTPWNTGVARGR